MITPNKRDTKTKSISPTEKASQSNAAQILSSLAELSQLIQKSDNQNLENLIETLQKDIGKETQPLPKIPTKLLEAIKKMPTNSNQWASQSKPEEIKQTPFFRLNNQGTLEINTPSQELNTLLEKNGNKNLTEFLKQIEKNHGILDKQKLANKSEIWNSLEATAWLALAYQELAHEEHQNPIHHTTQTRRQTKQHGCPELELHKNNLIETITANQKSRENLSEVLSQTTPQKVHQKIRGQIRRTIEKGRILSTQEAIEFSDELALKTLQNQSKHSEHFGTRTLLTSLYFEETKKFRSPEEHPEERILPSNSKFHKDTFLLVRYPLHQRSEIVPLKRISLNTPKETNENKKGNTKISKNKSNEEKTLDNTLHKKIVQAILGIIFGALLGWGVILLTEWVTNPQENPTPTTQETIPEP
jgi:hypothetical protein